jgi:ribosomal protein S18 acetylase RimI-like enzyme
MDIVEIVEFSPEVLLALNRLLPQLSATARTMTEADLRAVIRSEASHLYIVMESGQCLGSMTLVIFDSPTGRRARIEDVVVDSQERGKGVGQKLMAHALRAAAGFGAQSIDLTSNPQRAAANALYLKMGFERKQTHVYRILLGT